MRRNSFVQAFGSMTLSTSPYPLKSGLEASKSLRLRRALFIMMETWIGLFAALLISLSPIIYNVYFHPLRRFPGPWMAGATTWWKAYKEVYQKATLARLLFDLHEKYGDFEK